MTDIRAFVGHSFAEIDEEIVNKFLGCFNKIHDLDPRFSWEHARPLEPRELAEKVKSIISDKNVFIAICMKNERAISDSSLKKGAVLANIRKAKEQDFSWKTSDWIIQEIGLAVGKGLDLILLLEEGVRPPGGLQGNVEHMSFERDAPEKSFGNIIEMITALSPQTSAQSDASSDVKSKPPEDENVNKPQADHRWTTPQPDWTRGDYEMAYFFLARDKDKTGCVKISDDYLETCETGQGDLKISWEAYCECMRLRYGIGGSLANLEGLASTHPDSSKTLEYLAIGYERYEDYTKAAPTYEDAANKATSHTEGVRLLGRAAVCYTLSKSCENASEIIGKLRMQVTKTGNEEKELLNVLKNLAEINTDGEEAIAIMERMVEVDSSDINTRSSLAYEHSNCGNDDLALLHYLKIPPNDRNAMVWNNLGVQFDRAVMPAKAVNAYRMAEKMGETLSMSNLANKFSSAGFISEAQAECDEALKISDYHKNVAHTIARLTDVPEEEDKKESDIIEKVSPKSEFYRKFGQAMS